VIRPEGARETDRGAAGPPVGGPRSQRRRLAIAGGLAVALGIAAVALLLGLGQGSRSSDGPASSTPKPRQEPPWGFAGPWQDYCYRPLRSPPRYAVDIVLKGERCRSGSTRFTTAQQIDLTARAGATIDRLGVFWSAVEPTPPVTRGGRRVHAYSWAPLVRVYKAMLSAGIRPVVLASGTPRWARQGGWKRPGACRAPHGKPCSYPPSRRHLSDWRAFIAALLRRFPQMLALEVWNEPNLARFFAPHPSPALYSRLLRAADRAAHVSRVRAPVVTGGVTSSASRARGGIRAARFLSSIYELAGKASFDGIGTHPYPQGPPWAGSMSANLDRLRRVRDRFHDQATPLWITEVGVGGTSARHREGSVGLAGQGPILARMYRGTQNSDVRAFMIYTLRDSPTEGPKFEPFGVVRANLKPKPAYCYLARHLGGMSACGSQPRPPLGHG
jgi:polysaccharide biosynthesis protein PslG